ncbi:MAG: GNAT family N-acetyltransferase [Oscillospiraceae bacterium]|nr:GNAT family N-acetyltransferase [Oscillospiraceae bacterium]
MSETVRVGLAVLILKEGKVLLGHRSATRKDTGGIFEPDTWTVPGGKQEFGETMFEGAVREVREETGLELSDLRLFSASDDVQPDRHYVTLQFIACTESGEPKVMESDKEDDWRWFSLDDLPSNLYSPTRRFLDKYSASINAIERIELRPVRQNDPDVRLMQKLNEEAFPEAERVDPDDLYESGKSTNLDVLGIYSSDEFVGFIVTRLYWGIVYLAFLAVRPEVRSKGIGGKALQKLKEYYPGREIIVEFEAPDTDNRDNDIRSRRKGFYLRNGFNPTGWYAFYCGSEFEIASTAEHLNEKRYFALVDYLRSHIKDYDPKIYRKEET